MSWRTEITGRDMDIVIECLESYDDYLEYTSYDSILEAKCGIETQAYIRDILGDISKLTTHVG